MNRLNYKKWGLGSAGRREGGGGGGFEGVEERKIMTRNIIKCISSDVFSPRRDLNLSALPRSDQSLRCRHEETLHPKRTTSRKHACIILTPFKPHFYIDKLRFTGVYTIFLISPPKHRLWVLVRTASSRRF